MEIGPGACPAVVLPTKAGPHRADYYQRGMYFLEPSGQRRAHHHIRARIKKGHAAHR